MHCSVDVAALLPLQFLILPVFLRSMKQSLHMVFQSYLSHFCNKVKIIYAIFLGIKAFPALFAGVGICINWSPLTLVPAGNSGNSPLAHTIYRTLTNLIEFISVKQLTVHSCLSNFLQSLGSCPISRKELVPPHLVVTIQGER